MNSKRLGAAVAVLAFALIAAGVGPAAKGPNPFHGKSLYKTTCKLCHGKGGEAKTLTPMSKTQAQWESFFATRSQVCFKKAAGKTGKALSAEDVGDMKFFLVSHAADSDQPETCGD